MGTKELCQRLNITARQVQWWCEHRLLKPLFDGHGRQFDAAMLLEAAVIIELRRKGLSLQRIRSLHLSELPEAEFLVVQVKKRRHLYCSAAELLPYLAKASGACCVVSLEDLRARLKDPAKVRRKAA